MCLYGHWRNIQNQIRAGYNDTIVNIKNKANDQTYEITMTNDGPPLMMYSKGNNKPEHKIEFA